MTSPLRRLLRIRLLLLACLPVVAGCDFRERGEDRPGEALPPAVAVPPSVAPLGPVFAPADEVPLVVGDEFWFGSGTVGYELVGTFVSRAAMGSVLEPGQPVILHLDREWTLSDILVAVDYRGPGTSATWRVVGPPEVLGPYVADLEAGVSGRSPITSLGVLQLEVRHCCLEAVPSATP